MSNHKRNTFNCDSCNLRFPTEMSLGWHQKLFHFDVPPKENQENQPNQQNQPNQENQSTQENQQSQNECKICNANTNGEKTSSTENGLINKENEKDLEVRCGLLISLCFITIL